MNLVFFDFDDSVTTVDTTLPFSTFFSQHPPSRRRVYPLVLTLGLLRFGLVSNGGLKRTFARRYLRGHTVESVQRLAAQFHAKQLPALINDAVFGALTMHADRGDQVYLVSANFDCLLAPLVPLWSLAGVVATQAEENAGVYTGRLAGAACNGGEKLRAVLARFGPAAVAGAVAYGNRDDAPLLRAVQTGYLVRRVEPIRPLARLRQWRQILSGTLTRADLVAERTIERFPRSPEWKPPSPAGA